MVDGNGQMKTKAPFYNGDGLDILMVVDTKSHHKNTKGLMACEGT